MQNKYSLFNVRRPAGNWLVFLFYICFKTRTGNCIWKQHPEYRSPYRITDFDIIQ